MARLPCFESAHLEAACRVLADTTHGLAETEIHKQSALPRFSGAPTLPARGRALASLTPQMSKVRPPETSHAHSCLASYVSTTRAC